jgi:hypothetical protein
MVVLVNLIFLSLDFEYFICVMPTEEARTTVDSHTWSILEWFPERESGIALSWACFYLGCSRQFCLVWELHRGFKRLGYFSGSLSFKRKTTCCGMEKTILCD